MATQSVLNSSRGVFMIALLLKQYWRQLAAFIIVAAIALWIYGKWVSYGNEQFSAGYAKAVADQKAEDKKEGVRRNAEKQQIQADAQQRIDAARNDAVSAAAKSGKLQQQIGNIRQQLIDYSRTESTGNSAASTGVLLARVLSESIERNRALADYADRAREAGLTCQKQYLSLNKKAPK